MQDLRELLRNLVQGMQCRVLLGLGAVELGDIDRQREPRGDQFK